MTSIKVMIQGCEVAIIPSGVFQGSKITENGDLVRLKGTSDFVKQKKTAAGLYYVETIRKGVWAREYVHVLVALAFINNPTNEKICHHIDGDFSNNHVSNIAWGELPDSNLSIPGFSNYKITKDGEIYNVLDPRKYKMRTQRSLSGYVSITITNDEGEAKSCYVHRLVGMTYIPNPLNLPEIDHINRNRDDNRLDNLRWVDKATQNKNKDNKTKNVYKRIPYTLLEGEIALPLKGDFPGYHINLPYKITNYGNIINKQGTKLRVNLTGNYPSIRLGNRCFQIHILVALFFVKGRTQEKCVPDHIDENRHNYKAENLEWVTRSENCLRAAYKRRRSVNKIDPETGEILETYPSLISAARSIDENNAENISSGINKSCKGVRNLSNGYKWAYA